MVAAVKSALSGDEVFVSFDKKDIRMDVYMNAEWIGNHLELDRAPFVPFLRDIITDPAEIYLLFEKNVRTGRVRLSVNFIKGIDIGKGKTGFLVSRVNDGYPQGWTFIPTRVKGIDKFRKGKLLYER